MGLAACWAATIDNSWWSTLICTGTTSSSATNLAELRVERRVVTPTTTSPSVGVGSCVGGGAIGCDAGVNRTSVTGADW